MEDIIESVDSISRDGPDCPYMQYNTKFKISQSMYRFKSFNCHYRNLRYSDITTIKLNSILCH